MGMTAHWIDDNWKLWDLVVAAVEIEGDHSGQNLEQHLFNVLEEFNLFIQGLLYHQRQCFNERHNCNVPGATVYHSWIH